MKIAPLAEVKDRLSAYIDAARESAIVVTRNGKPVALLTPILEDDDLDSLLLTHDRKFIRLLARARKGAHRPLPEQRAVLAGTAASADATRDDTDVAPVAEGEPAIEDSSSAALLENTSMAASCTDTTGLSHAISLTSASACSSQNRISMSRYTVVAQQEEPGRGQALDRAVELGLRLGIDPVEILEDDEDRLAQALPETNKPGESPRGGRVEAGPQGTRPGERVDLHRVRQALDRDRPPGRDLDVAFGELQGGGGEQDGAGRRHLLHAGGQVGRLTDRRVVHVEIRPDGTDDDLAGVEPQADLDGHPVRAEDPLRVLRDCSSIEPLRSAKRTVTCLRSPSSALLEVRIFSARCCGVYDLGDCRWTAGGGVTGVPHEAQNFLPRVSASPQFGRASSRRVPQPSQNLAPSRFWDWHRGHRISRASGARTGGPSRGGGTSVGGPGSRSSGDQESEPPATARDTSRGRTGPAHQPVRRGGGLRG